MAEREHDIPPEQPEAPREDAARSRMPRALRVVLITLGAVAGGLVLLVLLFILALQTNRGGTRFADFLLGLVNPFDGATTEYDALRGNFISRIELHNLRITRVDTFLVDTVSVDPLRLAWVRFDSALAAAGDYDAVVFDTVRMAQADTLRLRYNLLSLFRKAVHVNEVYLAGPRLNARQRSNGSWDLLEPFQRDTSVVDTTNVFTFEIDDARITDAHLTAEFYPPRQDSTLRVQHFNIHVRDIAIGDEISVSLDTLYAQYMLPGQAGWTQLQAGGVLDDNRLAVTGLHLTSDRSRLVAQGTLRLPEREDEVVEDIDFRLQAEPVAFRDLLPFAPMLNPDATATLDVHVLGSLDVVQVAAAGSFGNGATLQAEGNLSPAGGGRLTYTLSGEIRRLDPGYLTQPAGPATTALNVDFDIDLRGTRLDSLSGTVQAKVFDSRVADVFIDRSTLDAELEDGLARIDARVQLPGSGPIVAEGTLRPLDEVPAYNLRGRVTRFNLASVLDDPAQQSDVTGTFSIDGTGFAPETATIDAVVSLDRSTINAYRVEEGRAELHLAQGDLDFGVRMLFPEGFVAVNGQAQFRDEVTYAVQRGRIENVDVAALLGQPEASALNGNFRLEGRGTDPQTLVLASDLDLFDSVYGPYRLAAADLNVQMRQGLLTVQGAADLVEAGSFELAMRTRPFDPTPTLQITQAVFRDVDVGVLTQNPAQQSDLDGTASFTLTGFDPATMRLQGQFTLRPSRFNEQEINGATVTADLRQGALRFDAGIDIPSGDVRLEGTARPFLAMPTYSIEQGSFEGIDLAAFTGNPALRSDLNGTLSASGRSFDPARMVLEGRLDLSRSRFNEQTIESAFLDGTWRDGALDFSLGLDLPEGRTRLAGAARPLDEVPTYMIREGTFAGLNVGAFIADPNWQTNLNGTISLEGSGLDPDSMALDARITFSPSIVNDAQVSGGTLDAVLDDGLLRFGADFVFPEGRARVDASGRFFDEVPAYQAEGHLQNVDVADFLGNDTLTARFDVAFDVEGRGLDPETMTLAGRVTSRDAQYENIDLDTLYADFRLNDGLLRLDSLLLRSNVADARGAGQVVLLDSLGTRASDFSFTADVRDLAPLRPFIGAEQFQLQGGTLSGRVYGPSTRLQFDVDADLQSLVYNTIRLADFEGQLAGELGPDRRLTLGEMHGEMENLSLPQFVVQRGILDVRYEDDDAIFNLAFEIDERRNARLAGRVDLRPDNQHVLLEDLTVRLDTTRWQLLQPATITYGDAYRISGFLLYADDQQIAVDGIIDPDDQQSLVMTVENVRIDAVTDLLDFQGLGGTVNGSIDLTGPGAAPNLAGTLVFDMTSYRRNVGNLVLNLGYDDLRLQIDALLSHAEGGTLSIDGYIPLDLRLAEAEGTQTGGRVGIQTTLAAEDTGVNLTVTSDSFAIGWIRPFLDPEMFNAFDGRLAGEFEIRGTLGSPVLSGSATLADGVVGLTQFGVAYRNIRAAFMMEDNRIVIQDAVMESGSGTATATGTVNLTALTLGEFDIALQADNFLAVDSREYSAEVDATLQLQGTTERPIVTGKLQLREAEINLTDQMTSPEFETVELTEADIRILEQRFGLRVTAEDTTTFDFYEALTMDLDVEMRRNTWLRSRSNPAMEIQFSGNLDLSKQPYEDIQIFGSIEVVPEHSSISQFGKRFNLETGTLTFNGPATDPYIDVEAAYEVPARGGSDPEVAITLSVDGRLQEQLNVELGSRNPTGLEMTDILSYLATGRPAAGGLALGSTAQTLAFDQLAALIEGFAGAELGLDVVEVEQLGLEGTTVLTAGKYVSPRLFVSVSQPVSLGGEAEVAGTAADRPSTIITIEYQVWQALLLRLMRGNTIRVNLLWEYAY